MESITLFIVYSLCIPSQLMYIYITHHSCSFPKTFTKMALPKSLFYAFFLILFSSIRIAHNMYLSPSPAPNPAYDDNDNIGPTVFDVTSFGATGDCGTDDTSAFKMAWDAACMSSGSKSALLLVPYTFCFLVKPTSFNGPCRTNLVLQVS